MGTLDKIKYDVKEVIVPLEKECIFKKISGCRTKKEKALCGIRLDYHNCDFV
jgi:hypothetical protein